jgi:NADH-quinone oxidoreductase subunit J
MTVEQVAFYVLAGFSVAAALGVVGSRNVVHAALFLMGTLLAVGAVFLLLAADFLALVQVLIYGGAVTMLLLFAIMLTRAEAPGLQVDARRRVPALVAAGAFLAVLVVGIAATPWPAPVSPTLARVDVEALGQALFGPWAIPFEIASLVLLVALLGGVIIARAEDEG